ncbi:MAG: hypothetical protein K2Y22_11590 [Candidatus Obscuribacterales bacterium]|nr:hypothetical protein [Candidatus Obscuribacterales bacterium]
MSKTNMNIKYFAMSALALTAMLIAVNPANAQQRAGARFSFAPNYYKTEEPKVPQMSHAVQSGSVPKGANFLGLDPSMLEKPKSREQVAARPAFTTVTPKVEFNSAFGQPAIPPAEVKPMMAQAKSKPLTARPIIAHRGHHTTSVNAKLMRKKAPSALDATPAQLASYDKNVGYAPGTYLPTSASDGYQRNADVHGKVLKN